MFDPTIPVSDTEMKSAEMRSQFTGLKAFIDDQVVAIAALTARVAALEPRTSYEAVGFGDPNACGTYTVAGMYNGKPIYVNVVSGYALIWNLTNMWQIATADPRTSMWSTPYARSDANVAGDYTVFGGMPPAGTVS